jgi:hypothetical protein
LKLIVGVAVSAMVLVLWVIPNDVATIAATIVSTSGGI